MPQKLNSTCLVYRDFLNTTIYSIIMVIRNAITIKTCYSKGFSTAWRKQIQFKYIHLCSILIPLKRPVKYFVKIKETNNKQVKAGITKGATELWNGIYTWKFTDNLSSSILAMTKKILLQDNMHFRQRINLLEIKVNSKMTKKD